jgi:predicted DsbA family dithiol-disulfide isomerase
VYAVLWSDYLCPWCYLGRDSTATMEALDVTVTHLPFELHPDVPPSGRVVRPDGRLAALLAHIGAQCAEVGLPFRTPSRLPNTRRALESAEVVRTRWPEQFDAIDTALFESVFVTGEDIGDASVLDSVLERAGAPAVELRSAVDAGAGAQLVAAAMELARSHGVASTPTWVLDGALLIPGAQPRDVLTRWIESIRRRSG